MGFSLKQNKTKKHLHLSNFELQLEIQSDVQNWLGSWSLLDWEFKNPAEDSDFITHILRAKKCEK